MLKIITLISSTFIIISLLDNQAISKTTDVDKLLNQTSLTTNKKNISSFKKYKLTSALSSQLIDKSGQKKVNYKSFRGPD